ncbi:MAG: hypothetical protein JWL87_206 [Candidatus Adlerbacteria bacterium]|nr:hypothetical protein [Candidatus Adlerbacteria bacterium]
MWHCVTNRHKEGRGSVMLETGIDTDRFSGPMLFGIENYDPSRIPKPRYPADPSILDMSPIQIKERRRKEVHALLAMGPYYRKAPPEPLAVRINDRHKRVDVWGRSRCHIGTADDIRTVAGDDDLSNHLYIADDLYLRATGMTHPLSDTYKAEEAEHYVGEIDGENLKKYSESAVTESADELDALPPGVLYSTDSVRHRLNVVNMEKRRLRKIKRRKEKKL